MWLEFLGFEFSGVESDDDELLENVTLDFLDDDP